MAGTTGTDRLPRILSVSDKAQPVWASDAGRNSNSSKFSGTFKGYVTDLQINFGRTTQAEMTQIKNALEKPNGIITNFTYRNTNTGEVKTEDFYGTVIDATYNNEKAKYQPFSVSLKGVNLR